MSVLMTVWERGVDDVRTFLHAITDKFHIWGVFRGVSTARLQVFWTFYKRFGIAVYITIMLQNNIQNCAWIAKIKSIQN